MARDFRGCSRFEDLLLQELEGSHQLLGMLGVHDLDRRLDRVRPAALEARTFGMIEEGPGQLGPLLVRPRGGDGRCRSCHEHSDLHPRYDVGHHDLLGKKPERIPSGVTRFPGFHS
jgi:hypothetical protein